ncbi:hypothetical protein [Cohnella sp. REN36]|uniref:hypothetical protein n=1 Tax=Cohnella sp. REN36 TaxID=2887347 RepID=UPI001D1513F9|nr:hypothetical protein [Cohnella sp. REN36]MCC3376002.1 hypothetical protein [Cohnella sp. REN36]
MTTISYYISDNGFGHASRSIAIIRKILSLSHGEIRIFVCGGKVLPFLRESLRGYPNVRFREVASDLGYKLQHNTIEADLDSFNKAYHEYVRCIPAQIDEERVFLKQNQIALVVSDISPIPFVAANQSGIVSVGISNFTWYTAYKQFIAGNQLQPLYDAYKHMSYFVRLPGSDEPMWGQQGQIQASFFCRAPNQISVTMLKKLHNPENKKMVVMFSPGMNIPLDGFGQEMWNDDSCLFYVSFQSNVRRSNVIRIPPEETESQNYVAASDLVVTKPGWGTVSEAVSFGKPLLLLKRSHFEEDRSLIHELDQRYPFRLIEWKQMTHTRHLRDFLPSMETGFFVNQRDSERAVQTICDFLMQVMDRG